ncbi:SEC-C motif-containing protein [Deinobacterium chartae]|uniref:UPF0225 protein HNR42_000981 n=1 Tax=Deinobacterium chartae TaxID=521158 RepID=A0A841HY37_9DEIO|nr:YchJ family protein [Deinobacterium chartae]MBB6097564.1 SEC-C motif-containing protein [Deinobacterium chartae]
MVYPAFKPCPCGSGRSFSACCGPLLGGEAAPTAEHLMRSRYTAYALGQEDYLLRTWAAATRPASLGLGADGVRWQSLEVRCREGGQAGDDTGTVEFVARFSVGGERHRMHEVSRFVREGGEWRYLDGELR